VTEFKAELLPHRGSVVWRVTEDGDPGQYCWQGQEQAEALAAELNWRETLPIGLRTSNLLIGARSVRSKAWTTLYAFRAQPREFTGEEQAILNSLETVVDALSWIQRTGPKPEYKPEAT
jgi:hypothetical protein